MIDLPMRTALNIFANILATNTTVTTDKSEFSMSMKQKHLVLLWHVISHPSYGEVKPTLYRRIPI